MHLPEEANFGPGEAVAIVGAALRFPGASDPSAFHEITVAGRGLAQFTSCYGASAT